MQKILIGKTEVSGQPTLYYLLRETAGTVEHYGVEIIRGTERSRVKRIAVSGDRVWDFAERLMKNGVTPTTLQDVVEDWLLA